jgi:hypothetical protein
MTRVGGTECFVFCIHGFLVGGCANVMRNCFKLGSRQKGNKLGNVEVFAASGVTLTVSPGDSVGDVSSFSKLRGMLGGCRSDTSFSQLLPQYTRTSGFYRSEFPGYINREE